MLHYIFGWIGALLLTLCGLPQAAKVWKTKKADDLSWIFLLFWLFGEILTLIYLVDDDLLLKTTHIPLYANYGFNIVISLYLVLAKYAYSTKKLIE